MGSEAIYCRVGWVSASELLISKVEWEKVRDSE